MTSSPFATVETADDLREILGPPTKRAADKDREVLAEVDRRWLRASPLCMVATCDAAGRCDVSPKGDPAGFVHVINNRQLAIPERPGNRRADSFHNVLRNPHVGLIFLVPGRTDTLRINGRARIVKGGPFFEDLIVKGHRPQLAMLVDIDEIFYHCAKSFMRCRLWDPSTWRPDAVPSRAEIVKTLEAPDETLEQLQNYYGAEYATKLYRDR